MSHSLQTSLKVGNSTGSSLSHFALQNAPQHSLMETGRDCRQASQVPVPSSLRSQDFVMWCRMWFCIVLLKYAWTSLERCLLEGSILCSKISMYFSALMVPSQKCKLPLPRALTQPHTMTGPWLLDLLLVTVWMILSSLVRSTRRPFLPKIPEILIHLTTVHVSTV